jgi:hypothetical protein
MSDAAHDILMGFVAAFDRHDPDGIVKLYALGATTRLPDSTDEVDVRVVRAAYVRWFTALPDARIEVRSGVADGGRAVAEVVIIGTNTGPVPLTDLGRAVLGTTLEALPPTGRTVAMPGRHDDRHGPQPHPRGRQPGRHVSPSRTLGATRR